MMLGMHKDVQEKLDKEIEEVYSNEKDTTFNHEFLLKFPFLDMVIKETMRLFTVVPVVARITSEEVDINGYLLPKGATILISLHAMHRDKKYWGSDAELFRPERFEDGPENPNAFAPFTGKFGH
jgi:cytochrome P450